MNKHTDTPWHRNGTLIEGPRMGLTIATVHRPKIGNAPRDEAEFEANANVLAAAGELFAALKEAAPPDFSETWLPYPIWEKARAAIAKAEGR